MTEGDQTVVRTYGDMMVDTDVPTPSPHLEGEATVVVVAGGGRPFCHVV